MRGFASTGFEYVLSVEFIIKIY